MSAVPAGVLAVRGSESPSAQEAALRQMFLQIDTNCDCLVSWDELSTHLLLGGGAGLAGGELDGSWLRAELPARAPNMLASHRLQLHLGNVPNYQGAVRTWHAA